MHPGDRTMKEATGLLLLLILLPLLLLLLLLLLSHRGCAPKPATEPDFVPRAYVRRIGAPNFKRIRLAHSCSSRMFIIRILYRRTVHLLPGLIRSMQAVLMFSHIWPHHTESFWICMHVQLKCKFVIPLNRAVIKWLVSKSSHVILIFMCLFTFHMYRFQSIHD